eukprot:TRINITY_DN11098_c0_g1_i1.p1 TRINITY_DN11098_c0_g1~~TRINITY_DN11098_c0_g1_i1.p1  ORF type:complete len:238 (+),score=58.38 TRINITY_DN11098_c0_g1_i1:85-798(+)
MAAPPAMAERLAGAAKTFEGNLGEEANAFGEKWRTDKNKDGAVAESSSVPGSSARCFRAWVEVRCPKAKPGERGCAERLMDLITDYAKRPQWDSGIASGTVEQRYQGGEEVIAVSTTGSTISPRWWRDCRKRWTQPDGSVRNITCAWDEGDPKAPKGLVKGVNHPGGGSAVLRCPKDSKPGPDGSECWRAVMVGHSDIGGWVPTSVVNAASSGGYHNTALQLAKQAAGFGCTMVGGS